MKFVKVKAAEHIDEDGTKYYDTAEEAEAAFEAAKVNPYGFQQIKEMQNTLQKAQKVLRDLEDKNNYAEIPYFKVNSPRIREAISSLDTIVYELEQSARNHPDYED